MTSGRIMRREGGENDGMRILMMVKSYRESISTFLPYDQVMKGITQECMKIDDTGLRIIFLSDLSDE